MSEAEKSSHKLEEFSEFGNILNKVSQIQEFFKMGDESTPFLAELFTFLKDLVPLMTEVNQSLHLSTSKLPTASDSISSATDTTEVATFQVMDKLEQITGKLSQLVENSENTDTEMIQSIQEDIQDTMTTLQFQDIAAQQLDHANRILEAIFQRFSDLFESLNQVRLTSKLGQSVLDALKEGAEDGGADNSMRQFDEQTQDLIRNGDVSQDDIDQLFKK
ncbi:MAG: hypothetical protein K9N34_05520 [Candidatus Marinimicrobia bacterium]|nr:hypothetical protein [Candidatus Neomarinimicrobiota bacterium]MCF7841068.1 hypothetical protein [Candidatus Neomarinimicrobiota bacterium]MCF7902295.1 hypothetical protein [Candidatus Neomarinimicrobiota bacterium]